MTALPRHKMTVDEFLAWAEHQPGRYELFNGTVYAMTPERAVHAETKFAIAKALEAAIARAGLTSWVLPDGMTVRVDVDTAYEPDALVYCGERLPEDVVEVPQPVIVVEVLSPSTRHVDAAAKLAGYFNLPSICHYLIIDPDKRLVIHHGRGRGDEIVTRIVRDQAVSLEPPGIQVDLRGLFRAGQPLTGCADPR
ncbi:MAG: Uma2 family endonuclease [Hyphomicrobiaceae bacterium]|nr:Uma2 family endonuclease [Hyphomicrobiaceae bacterium]